MLVYSVHRTKKKTLGKYAREKQIADYSWTANIAIYIRIQIEFSCSIFRPYVAYS